LGFQKWITHGPRTTGATHERSENEKDEREKKNDRNCIRDGCWCRHVDANIGVTLGDGLPQVLVLDNLSFAIVALIIFKGSQTLIWFNEDFWEFSILETSDEFRVGSGLISSFPLWTLNWWSGDRGSLPDAKHRFIYKWLKF